MTTGKIVLTSCGLIIVLGSSLAAQQSLGDLARAQRAERSRQTKKAAKIWTNDNLPAPALNEPTISTGGISPLPATEAPSEESRPEKSEDKMKTPDYWQGKFKAARADLAKAKEDQQLLEDEITLLKTQQARETAPDVQNEVAQKISARAADLQSKQAVTDKAQKVMDQLQKEFNESGAPEQWSKTEESP